jgi:hypothetical protein
LALSFLVQGFGQKKNIARCWLWKPKAGQEQNFENGYNKHLAIGWLKE